MPSIAAILPNRQARLGQWHAFEDGLASVGAQVWVPRVASTYNPSLGSTDG